MMFCRLAAPVDGFTGLCLQDIELPRVRKSLQGSVNGRQTHFCSAIVHHLVELLSGLEAFGPIELAKDLGSLLGSASTYLFHSNASIATMIATPPTSATTWMADLPGSGSL